MEGFLETVYGMGRLTGMCRLSFLTIPAQVLE